MTTRLWISRVEIVKYYTYIGPVIVLYSIDDPVDKSYHNICSLISIASFPTFLTRLENIERYLDG